MMNFCPNCQSKVNRKSYYKEVRRCKTCHSLMCGMCSVGKICINCYVKKISHDFDYRKVLAKNIQKVLL